jgi:hypothetical protein
MTPSDPSKRISSEDLMKEIARLGGTVSRTFLRWNSSNYFAGIVAEVHKEAQMHWYIVTEAGSCSAISGFPF